MRKVTLTASSLMTSSGTIRGGSFLSCLAVKSALLLTMKMSGAFPD